MKTKFNKTLFVRLFIFNPHLRTFFHYFQRERKGERETTVQERNIGRSPPIYAQTGDQTHNLGMCPDRELNLQPSGYWMTLQPTEPSRQGGFLPSSFLTRQQHFSVDHETRCSLVSRIPPSLSWLPPTSPAAPQTFLPVPCLSQTS